jgi:mono/diheme cytochrome c family protein
VTPARVAAAALATLLAAEGSGAAGDDPAHVAYMLHCQGCHLADGSGAPGAVPDLRGSLGRFLAVPGGRAYLVQVPGSAQSPLSDAELAAVLNWMVRRFGPADAAAALVPYDGAEVGRLRAAPLVDVEGARATLLRKLEAAAR